jgi:hypothetical protein
MTYDTEDYELHITCKPKSSLEQDDLKVLAHKHGWSTSKIDGDPILGLGVKFYLTTHTNSQFDAQEKINLLVPEVNKITPTVRAKIERIVYDKIY